MLSPLLYDFLHDQEIAPASVILKLQDEYEYTARRNLYMFYELGIIVRLLEENGIPTIVLKVVALAQNVYESIALRPMIDLDLLIRQEQLPAAVEALASLGYSQDASFNASGTLAFENAIPNTENGVEQLVLDIHWNLFSWIFYSKTIPLNWFWETALCADSGLSPAGILGPEAQVLYLCGHLSKHQSEGRDLFWLNDIAEVVRSYRSDLDWDLLLVQAQACNLVLSIQRVLLRVVQDLDGPVPDEIVTRCLNLTPSPYEA